MLNAFRTFQKCWCWISNDKLALLLISAFLIHLIGFGLNAKFQDSSWQREARFELLKYKLQDEQTTIRDLSRRIDRRWYDAQRVVWIIKDGKGDLEGIWTQYMESVRDWNAQVHSLQMDIGRFVGDGMASTLLTYEDDLNNEVPNSIHYKFYKLHDMLIKLRNCYYSRCDSQRHLRKTEVLIEAIKDQKFDYIASLQSALENEAQSPF